MHDVKLGPESSESNHDDRDGNHAVQSAGHKYRIKLYSTTCSKPAVTPIRDLSAGCHIVI